MSEKENSAYLPGAFTEDDWQLIANALLASKTKRGRKLSKAIVGWRIEVARSRAGFLRAFAALHHK